MIDTINTLLGCTGSLSLIMGLAYYRQTKRTKEAEAKQKEAEADMVKVSVEKGKIEARQLEIELLTAQLERMEQACEHKDQRLSELNNAIDKHIDRRRELADNLYDTQRELVKTKDEVIRLTDKSDRLEALKCLRADCRDPRGPKPPRKNQNPPEPEA